jgi:hypothetical protein
MAKLADALAGLGLGAASYAEARPGAEFVGYVLEAEKPRA